MEGITNSYLLPVAMRPTTSFTNMGTPSMIKVILIEMHLLASSLDGSTSTCHYVIPTIQYTILWVGMPGKNTNGSHAPWSWTWVMMMGTPCDQWCWNSSSINLTWLLWILGTSYKSYRSQCGGWLMAMSGSANEGLVAHTSERASSEHPSFSGQLHQGPLLWIKWWTVDVFEGGTRQS